MKSFADPLSKQNKGYEQGKDNSAKDYALTMVFSIRETAAVRALRIQFYTYIGHQDAQYRYVQSIHQIKRYLGKPCPF